MNERSKLVAGCLFSGAVTSIEGVRDNMYYPYPDFVNPNTYYKMYWRDAENVLEDIQEFDALYIRYHRCIWSDYKNPDGDSGDGGEESDYWYLGAPQRFRANTAYSLYGTLKDEKDKGCRRTTYINSFVTTSGVEAIAYPLGIDTSYANSICSSSDDSQDREMLRFLENGDDDGYYTSIGTGCSTKGKFVLDEFAGSKCDGSHYLNTTNTLDTFNSDMEGIDCTQIYTNSDDDDDEAYKLSSAYSILSYSAACSLRTYPNRCPDPYGRLKKYESNLDKALNLAKHGQGWELKKKNAFTLLSLPIFITGLVLFLASFLLSAYSKRKSVPKGRRRRGTVDKKSYVHSKYTSNSVDSTSSSIPTFSLFSRRTHPCPVGATVPHTESFEIVEQFQSIVKQMKKEEPKDKKVGSKKVDVTPKKEKKNRFWKWKRVSSDIK